MSDKMPLTDREVLALMVENGELEASSVLPVGTTYDFLFCEVCLNQYRDVLCRFADDSVFAICTECVSDLCSVVEVWGIPVELTSIRSN